MTPGDYKDTAIAVLVAMFGLRWAFTQISAYRRSSDERTSKADKVIATQLEKVTTYSREDYLRLEARVDMLEEKIEKKLDTILTRLDYISRWESSISTEVRSWPALIRRVDIIEHDVHKNRDGLNELRIKKGLPKIDQTPPHGVPVYTPAPHDVATSAKDDEED